MIMVVGDDEGRAVREIAGHRVGGKNGVVRLTPVRRSLPRCVAAGHVAAVGYDTETGRLTVCPESTALATKS